MEKSGNRFRSVATRCGALTSVWLIGLLGLGTDVKSLIRSGQIGISGNPLQPFGGAG